MEQFYRHCQWGRASTGRIYGWITESTVSLFFHEYLIQEPTKEIELEYFQTNVFCRPEVLLTMCSVLSKRSSEDKHVLFFCLFIFTITTTAVKLMMSTKMTYNTLLSSFWVFLFIQFNWAIKVWINPIPKQSRQ